MLRVYLAGGMRQEWRKDVYKYFEKEIAVSKIDFFDPTKTGFNDPNHYTAWDLHAIEQCDVVFAYLEEDNPSGIGMATEIGYAKGLGKQVIFVNHQPEHRYLPFVKETSDLYTELFSDGLLALNNYLRLYK